MNGQHPRPLFREYPRLAARLPHVPLATLPTPVESLDSIARKVGVGQLHIKRDDLSGVVYGGNKVRKLEFLFGEILRTRAREVLTFGFAGSNHALATAIYAAQLGMGSTSLLMPQINAHYVRRNLLASHHYRARLCHCRNIPLLSLSLVGQLFRGVLAHGAMPRVIPGGGSCPLGLVGYVNAAMELRDQVAAGELPEPDVIYVPLGSMGTSAGLILGLKAVGFGTRVIPVRVIEERMASPKRMMGLMRKTAALLCRLDPTFPRVEVFQDDLAIRNDCLGEGYARFTPEAVAAASFVEAETGIPFNGAYTSKALAALLADARGKRLVGRRVLFWNTFNSRDLSGATAAEDYRELPAPFHRYFEGDVQSLDREGGHATDRCGQSIRHDHQGRGAMPIAECRRTRGRGDT